MRSIVFLVFLFICGLVNAQNTIEKPTPLATLFDSIYSISNSLKQVLKKIKMLKLLILIIKQTYQGSLLHIFYSSIYQINFH